MQVWARCQHAIIVVDVLLPQCCSPEIRRIDGKSVLPQLGLYIRQYGEDHPDTIVAFIIKACFCWARFRMDATPPAAPAQDNRSRRAR